MATLSVIRRWALREQMTFGPGEAFQFDWSEDWAVIAGVRTKLQVAHFKLSCVFQPIVDGISA